MTIKTLALVLAALAMGGCGFFSSEQPGPEDPTTGSPAAQEEASSPNEGGAETDSGSSYYSSTRTKPRVETAPAGASVDRIVAAVNGEIITLKQLDNRVNSVMQSRQSVGVNRSEMRQKILEALIDQELINQAAKSKGVFVTESDVSMAIDTIKKDNNLTDQQFKASLAHSGASLETFREDLRIELLRNRVMGAQVVSKIVVTDSEVVNFLNGDGPDLQAMGIPSGRPDTRQIRLIIIPLNPNNKQGSLAEAKRIMGEIEGGLNFAAAAKKYSKGPGADKGGDTGDGATVANLPPQLQAAFVGKKAGQPIGPLEAGNAVVIMSPATDPEPEPERDRKLKSDEFSQEEKERARRQLEAYKMQQRYGEWVKDLKRNAVIRVNL